MDLQPVPNYVDNLSGQGGGRTEGTGARTYPLYYQRFFAPDLPTEFQRMVYASVGQMLPIYGAKLFLQSPSTFAPVDQVPVTSNYVVGPGDQLLIRVWGQMNFNAEVTVDREGMVYIPHVGAIHVGGVPYGNVQQQVRDGVARIYKNFDRIGESGATSPHPHLCYRAGALSGQLHGEFAEHAGERDLCHRRPGAAGIVASYFLRRNGTTVDGLRHLRPAGERATSRTMCRCCRET